MSPRRLALALALAPAARAPLRANELDALKRLYDATGGAAWRKKGGWSMDAATSCNGTVPPLLPDQNPNDDGGARAACIRHDPCARETKWYGVACIDPCYLPADGADCSHGRVTLLELRDNSLRGTLPAELFGTLINVSMVDLARNELSGSIPTQLGKLRNLQSLQLNGNMLSGTIPTELGTAGHALGVGWREDRSGLEGLTRLELAQNSLSGIVPSQIGMLESLQLVDLAGNEELGYLPTSDPNLQLNPGLPPEIGSLSHLQVLKLNGCGFRGTLPTQIGKMARLSQLYARGTTADEAASKHTGGAAAAAAEGVRIESNRFSGTLPTELGRLTRLQLLGLEANRLSGSIPSEIGELAELRRWETGENRLVGSMPDVFDRYLYLEYWDTCAAATHRALALCVCGRALPRRTCCTWQLSLTSGLAPHLPHMAGTPTR